LFFEFVDILRALQPRYFMLENVKMKKEWQDIITEYLGVEPVLINSALLSAQHRKRLYWANFEIPQPEDAGILLKDIVLSDAVPVALHNLYGGFKEKSVRVFDKKSSIIRTSAGGGHIPSFVKKDTILIPISCSRKRGIVKTLDKALPVLASDWRGLNRNQNQNAILDLDKLQLSKKALAYMKRKTKSGRDHWDFNFSSDIHKDKSACVLANFFKGVPYNVFKDWDCIRKFHPIECERLQTLPDDYTAIYIDRLGYRYETSPTQRYKMIGNGWTVDVVAYIFKQLKGLLS
jgi:site-specific DNA-cytosine methylase